jgi:hypothetical protein
MELLLIYVVVYIVGNAWDAKAAEYGASQQAAHDRIDRRYPNASPARKEQLLKRAGRRQAAGFAAYQMRHGWPSLRIAIHKGWKDARTSHEEWLADTTDRPAARDAARHAWDTSRPNKRAKQTEQPQPQPPRDPDPQAAPEPTRPDPAAKSAQPDTAEPKAKDAKVVPFVKPGQPSQPQSTGGTMSEAPNLDAVRAAAQQESQRLGERVSAWEQIIADMLAGGMAKDKEAMAAVAGLQEALNNAQALAASIIGTFGKHEGGEEYANSGHAAKTEYLQRS